MPSVREAVSRTEGASARLSDAILFSLDAHVRNPDGADAVRVRRECRTASRKRRPCLNEIYRSGLLTGFPPSTRGPRRHHLKGGDGAAAKVDSGRSRTQSLP